MRLIIAMLIAYFVGSIPTALWLGRSVAGKDIRQYGSGNLGATNAFRVLGKKLGIIVLLLDMLKGLAPVAILPPLLGMDKPGAATYLFIGMAAILGHVFSAFVNFKGGKGVATSLGVFLAIAPGAMLAIMAIGIGVIWITGYVSAGSITGAVLMPIFFYISGVDPLVLLIGEIIAVLVIVKHRANLQRLIAGTESKIYDRKADDDDQPIPAALAPRDNEPSV